MRRSLRQVETKSSVRHPRIRVIAHAKWLVRARPLDYLLAASMGCAGLPLIGRHLKPLGAITAIGAFACRQFPEFARATVRSRSTPTSRARPAHVVDPNAVARQALDGIVAADRLTDGWPAPTRVSPLVSGARQRRRYLHTPSVRYGDSPRQLLDVWRQKELTTGPAPVLVFVPGGGWVVGSRLLQGYALMGELAAQGWVCLSIGYRVSPHHRWPRHVMDVKAAVAWARANVQDFGGDPNFVAIAGCSAGGHLSMLTALTPGDPAFGAELAGGADTSVDAAVGIYGRYDWEDRSTPERDRFVDFLERIVVRKRFSRHRDIYRAASPLARLHPHTPPLLVVHGSSDTVIPVAQAREFVEMARATSQSPVGYLELPGAGHGFDMLDGARTAAANRAISLFLNEVHRARRPVVAHAAI
jgi:acetyl esterase/lipase